MISKWNPQKVIEAVAGQLMENADDAGKFVEQDARRRLYAIKDPEWGKKYRQIIVGGLLTHQVEREPRAVVIYVGVGVSADSRHHGYYIEVGSHTEGAQPWLRPAVFQNGSMIVRLLAR